MQERRPDRWSSEQLSGSLRSSASVTTVTVFATSTLSTSTETSVPFRSATRACVPETGLTTCAARKGAAFGSLSAGLGIQTFIPLASTFAEASPIFGVL